MVSRKSQQSKTNSQSKLSPVPYIKTNDRQQISISLIRYESVLFLSRLEKGNKRLCPDLFYFDVPSVTEAERMTLQYTEFVSIVILFIKGIQAVN